MARGPGAPSKFTQPVRDRLLTAVRGGAPFNRAAEYAGVSYPTLRKWLTMAENPDADEEYREFARDLDGARAASVVTNVALIRRSAMEDRDWRAAAWLLERTDRENFGKEPSKVELSGPDGGAIELRQTIGVDQESIDALAATLQERFEAAARAQELGEGTAAIDTTATETDDDTEIYLEDDDIDDLPIYLDED